eukprot:8630366-Pyramimonas_sp.AAC.1
MYATTTRGAPPEALVPALQVLQGLTQQIAGEWGRKVTAEIFKKCKVQETYQKDDTMDLDCQANI